MSTDDTSTTAAAGPVLSEGLGPLQPVAWWVSKFEQPLVCRGEAKPMLWPEATPLYTLTAEEVAAVNKLRARKEWMKRDTARCKCDHNEYRHGRQPHLVYCQHCWPANFRPGGPWHGLGA